MQFVTLIVTALLITWVSAGYRSNPRDEISIRNTLSVYAISVDSKQYTALANVFTSNFVGNFSLGGPNLRGLAATERVLASTLNGLVSQHKISTTVVNITSNLTANSTCYFEATFFGQGKLLGQIATAYGTYLDVWRRNTVDDMFLISMRNLVYAVCLLILRACYFYLGS